MTETDVRSKYGAISGASQRGNRPIRLSISVEAQEGAGKTQFGLLTCPTPIVHVNFGDRDATAFLYDMSPDRLEKVTLYSFAPAGPDGWTTEEARTSLYALSEVAKAELAGDKMAGGTFILDSGSSWWDAVQQVYVAPLEEAREAEGKKKSGGLIYQQANLIVSGVISWIKNQDINFIISHQKRQRWDKDGPVLGKFDARINSKVPYLVEVRLDLRKECIVCTKKGPLVGEIECRVPGHVGRRHIARIIKFGRNTSMEGMELEGSAISFETIYKLYAGTAFPEPDRLK